MGEIVTKPQLLTHFKMTAASLNNYITQGLPQLTQGGRGVRSKFDLDEVTEWLKDNVKSQNEMMNEAKLRKATADAALAELALEKARGEVIPIDDVIEQVSAENGTIRAKFLGLPSQLCDELAACNEKTQVLHILDSKVREILGELSLDEALKEAKREQQEQRE